MRVVDYKPIDRFTKRHRVAVKPINRWSDDVGLADWSSPDTARETMPGYRSIGRRRVVFDVGGHRYRIVAIVDYVRQRLEIRFVGTHDEYDRIDALRV